MFVEVIINKPIYGTYIGIRDKYIREAKNSNRALHIIIPGIAEAYMSWESWMDGAEKIEKEYLIPGKPMILFANHLSKFVEKE